MAVTNVTSENFEQEVLEHKDETIFVDFWASWCAPCRAIAPMFEKLSEEVEAKFAKVNVDENQSIAMEFSVRAIPTILAIRDGEVVDTMVGAGGLDLFVNDNL